MLHVYLKFIPKDGLFTKFNYFILFVISKPLPGGKDQPVSSVKVSAATVKLRFLVEQSPREITLGYHLAWTFLYMYQILTNVEVCTL